MSDTKNTPDTPPEAQAVPDAPGPAPVVHDDEGPPRGVRAAAIFRWLLVVAVAAATFGSLGYFFGWFESSGSGSSSATTYYCPMHPSVKQDHPGECPICSMTLVPMPKQAEAAPPASGPTAQPTNTVPGLVPVDLPPQRVQLMGIRTARVVTETLQGEIRTVGMVTANEQALAEIQTRFSGWIQTLAVSQTGQKVAKGQVVATVYSPDILAAQQELVNATRWEQPSGTGGAHADDHQGTHEDALAGVIDLTKGLKGDARARLELLGIAKQDIDEIVRTGKPMREIRLRSPVSGYVIQKNVVEGTYVQPGTPLLAIADLSTVWVVADVYEYEVARVRVGLEAKLALAAYSKEKFTGKVSFLYPTVDPSTRTLRVRIELKNKDLRVRPGMYGDVYLATDKLEGLVVPAEAIVDTGELQYVFVAKEGGRFEPRRVHLGARTDDKVQVLDGVADGEIVVTTANFLIDSESRLRAAIQGEGGGGGAAPAASSACDKIFDQAKYPDKYAQCRSCEQQHHGMGSMEDDCRNAIPKPWK
jgi:Cu(I)/Ag(I) efflux system membrane fusion protein